MVKIEQERTTLAVFAKLWVCIMRDDCIKDGRFDVTTYHPLAFGYRDYAA